MSERHVADAVRGEFLQDAEIAVDHVAAFDGEQDGDFLLCVGGADLVGGCGEPKIVGMLVHLSVDGLDLFLRAFDGDRTSDFAGHPTAKKTAPTPPSFMRGMSTLPFCFAGEVEVGVDEALSGVGVGVDDKLGEMELTRLGEIRFGRAGWSLFWAGEKE